MAPALPTHPTLVHPLTGEPLRAIYVSPKTGRAWWPVLGAADDDGGDDGDSGGGDADTGGDTGFPAGTPIAEMTSEQQAAYWKHQARRHEGRAKAFGDLTPDKLAELREKAGKHDELELELGTTADKAAAKAAEDARAAARAESLPEVINARLDAAAARAGVSEEDLAKAVEFVDSSKFLTADGGVDTDKVKAFVGTITPVKGSDRKGPSAGGTGRRTTSSSGVSSVASGREMFAERHKKTT